MFNKDVARVLELESCLIQSSTDIFYFFARNCLFFLLCINSIPETRVSLHILFLHSGYRSHLAIFIRHPFEITAASWALIILFKGKGQMVNWTSNEDELLGSSYIFDFGVTYQLGLRWNDLPFGPCRFFHKSYSFAFRRILIRFQVDVR